MPRALFVGQSERNDSYRAGHTARLVNWYRERLGEGAKSTHVLKGVPRANDFLAFGDLFVRDIRSVDGVLYALVGGTLYRISESGMLASLANTASAEGSMIFGAEDGKVCVVADGRYFVWDGATLDEPTTGAFSGFGSGAFLGDYVLLSERNGRRFQWSDLADAKTLPGVNFATAESTDSNLLRIVPIQGRVLLMKEDAIEQWAATGQAGALAFSPLPGGVFEVGLKAAGLVTRFTGGVFFVGNNGIVYISNGSQVQPISTPAVNAALSRSTPTHCFSYDYEGHIFCAIRFSDREAWIYDIATGEWHERASGQNDPWQITTAAQGYGAWFGGDVSGNLYRFSNTGTDGGVDFVRTAVSNEVYNEGRLFRVPMVEFNLRTGQGAIGETEPKIMVSFSDDGGLTYGHERTRDLGGEGEFDQLVRVRSVGSQRRLCCKVVLSDPRDLTMDAAVNVVIA